MSGAYDPDRESWPVLQALHLGTNDQALRLHIRGEAPLPKAPVQFLICENARYADAMYSAWVNLKIKRTGKCGGGWHERYVRNGQP